MACPEMVAGENRSSTDLMRAMKGKVAVKTGAEGAFVAIVPERQIGVALKIMDGTQRGQDCAIAQILVLLGLLDPDHPAAQAYRTPAVRNRNGTVVGRVAPAPHLTL